MIRVLFMIAIAGFVLSVGTLAAAVAIGGPETIARGGWIVAGNKWANDWDVDWDWDNHSEVRRGHDDWRANAGPQVTRTLEWSGAKRLDVDLAADVRYIQQAGPASLTVSGPDAAVQRVIVRGDSIRYRSGRHRGYPRLTIVLRAPDVSGFNISGHNSLAIENYRQPRIGIDVSGDADVTATGEADEVNLDISGDAKVDVGALKSKGASVDISGSGDATIAPTEWANLDISGAGDVRLLTRPARLETDISGAGKVHQGGPSPSPSPSPTPSPSPSPKSAKL